MQEYKDLSAVYPRLSWHVVRNRWRELRLIAMVKKRDMIVDNTIERGKIIFLLFRGDDSCYNDISRREDESDGKCI